MPRAVSKRIYELYGRTYGAFEFFFKRRIAKTIRKIPLAKGDRVLDIGVGTGLSLPYYPKDVSVVGVDLSPGMLAKAKKKASLTGAHLVLGDALSLPFADAAFDCVFMSHVIGTVPDPHAAMREAMRVARDGAMIAILNHFRSPYPVVGWIEMAVDPISRKLGWRNDLSLRGLLEPLGIESPRPAFGWAFQGVYLRKIGAKLAIVNPEEAPATEPVADTPL
jgi:phosphatidylethanolamine/phosphatidyl-N-methylethanolamine N-methyltransferase